MPAATLRFRPAAPVLTPERLFGYGLIALGVILLHVLPFIFVTFVPSAPAETDEAISIDILDQVAAIAQTDNPQPTLAKVEKPEELPPAKPLVKTEPPKPPPAQKKPEPPPPEQPKAQPQPAAKAPDAPKAPAPAKAEPPKTEPAKAPEPAKPAPEINQIVVPKNTTAFDESKSTKEIPKDGYLSDRNSTAADRGPKNLPRGDPFMDKGESNAIRYQEKRGEGNVPPVDAGANAGSVKQEGSPDAGNGKPLERVAKPELPKPAVANTASTPIVTPPPSAPDAMPAKTLPPPGLTRKQEPVAPAKPKEPDTFDPTPPDNLKDPGSFQPKPVPPKDEPAKPAQPAFESPLPPVTDAPPAPPPGALASDPLAKQIPPPPVQAPKQDTELDAFAALLDNASKTGAPTNPGKGATDKGGPLKRVGARGHEGDGSFKPGHNDAVSDVTTLNTLTSAEGYDDARFAKRYDPEAAYIKSSLRRIDAKWKSEIIARLRNRNVPGAVTMRVMIRKDGVLLLCEEYQRQPQQLPDEYVAILKSAIKLAFTPAADPFPPELDGRASLEFPVTFLYQ